MENINANILPEALWTFFMTSLDCFLAYKYEKRMSKSMQVWTLIPIENRQWVTMEQLEKSNLVRQKNVIGLDFDYQHPIMSNGYYWIEKIKESMGNHNNLRSRAEGRNIYLFDKKMEWQIFYLYEEGGILVNGDIRAIQNL